jgi:DNA-directed RNA polymerase subunit RPC12/RpoP
MAATATITCPDCRKTFRGKMELNGKRVRCPRCQHPFLVELGTTLKVDRGGDEDEVREAIQPAVPKRSRPAPPPLSEAEGVPAAVPPPPEPGGTVPPPPVATPAAAVATPAAPPSSSVPGLLDEDEFGEDNPNPYGVTTIDLRARCPNCANPLESDEAVVCLHCGYNTSTRAAVKTKKTVETTRQDQFSWLLPGLLCLGGAVALVLTALFYTVALPAILGDSFFVHESLRMWTTIIILAVVWPLGRFALNRLVLNPTPPEFIKEEK